MDEGAPSLMAVFWQHKGVAVKAQKLHQPQAAGTCNTERVHAKLQAHASSAGPSLKVSSLLSDGMHQHVLHAHNHACH
jgi:hypothetical protein